MSNAAVFPAIIRPTYEPGQGFPKMVEDALRTSTSIRRKFDADFAGIGRSAQQSLAKGLTGGGALNFNLAGLKGQLAEVRTARQSLELLQQSELQLAITTGDTTARTQSLIAALNAQVASARQAERATQEQVTASARLQAALDRDAAGAMQLTGAYRELEQARNADAIAAARAEVNNRAFESSRGIGAAPTKSAQASAAVFDEVFRAQERLATSANRLRSEIDPAYAAQARFNTEMAEARTLISAGSISLDEYCAKLRQERLLLDQTTAAGQRHTAGSAAQRAGMQQLSMQLNDVATMYAMGAKPQQIFASQLDQVLQAVQLASGGTSKFATFLMGPWGIGLTAGALVLTPLITKLFETSEAAKAAEAAGKSLAERQADVANFFDLSTGRIKENSRALIENAKAALYARTLEIAKEQRDRHASVSDILRASQARQVIGYEKEVQVTGHFTWQPVYSAPNRELIDAVTQNRGNRDSMFAAVSQLAQSKSPAAPQARQLSDYFANTALSARQTREAEAKLKSLETGTLDSSLRTPPSRSARGGGGRSRTGGSEAQRLADYGEGAAERIKRLNEQFDDQPRLIDQAARATRELDAIIADLAERRPPNFEKLTEDARQAQGVVAEALSRPIKEFERDSQRRLQIQELIAQAREDEAKALQAIFGLEGRLGDIGDNRRQQIRDTVMYEEQRTRELERQRRQLEAQASMVTDMRANLVGAFAGLRTGGAGAFGRFFSQTLDQFTNAWAENVVDSVFGEAFASAEGRVTNQHNRLADAGALAADAMLNLERATLRAAAITSGDKPLEAQFDAVFSHRPTASNDNGANAGGDIEVRANYRDPRRLLGMLTERVADVFLDKRTAEKIGKGFAGGLEGAMYGQMGASLFMGRSADPFASAAGGALAESFLTKPLSKGLDKLAKGLGDASGPLAGLVGGLALNGLMGALKSTPRGSATIGGLGGSLVVVSTQGNSKARREASSQSAGEAITTLERLAEELGASLNASLGAVSVGMRDGSWRVDTTGSGITKTSRGAIDFGQDSAAAIKAATMDLIRDGVITGLRSSTRYLLQQAKDLDTAIKKAVDFEGIFGRLREYKDPAGAAVEAVNKEFERLRKLAIEAKATAEEMAQLEELYGIERSKAFAEAVESLTAPLKNLMTDLQTGDMGLSLRDRMSNAMLTFNPLAEAIRGGKAVDNDKFAEASRTVLDIARQMYGSQDAYFATFNEVFGLSKMALDGQQSAATAAGNLPSPFATTAAPSVDTVPMVTAINDQSQMLLTQIGMTNQKLDELIRAANNNAPSQTNPWGIQANTYF